ncbi:MAG: AraC family transcriptional regulator [Spirochaetes bacterium]|nr:AraC family transcriptional regulator [Spirochaetota bacterium]
MILYWNEGKRWYGKNPIPVYRRVGWEFQLFLSGTCRLLKADGSYVPVEPGTLWVFPPTTPHGWGGDPTSACEIRVVHFARVREPLGEICSRNRWLQRSLKEDQIKRLVTLFDETGKAHQENSSLLELHAERLLIELSFIVLPDDLKVGKPNHLAYEERIVFGAISYFRDHMHEAVTIEQVAKAVSISPSHLRRLFHKVKGVSPRRLFQEERFHRAEEMLKETNYTMNRIAIDCGFESGSSFIRTFHRKYGMTPKDFRYTNR